MKERVVVAMSGGVDSSVAAALLQEQGYDVVGLTMYFSSFGCSSMQGIKDARRVAHRLGIKHYVLNLKKVLEDKVIKDFCQEYCRGRTPNPCVRCNQYIKFGVLLKKAIALGASYLATGHYARVVKGKSYLLKKAIDLKKDQSYFLYRLNQQQLKHLLLPLGEFTKEEVRGLARNFHLAVAEKNDSQEICFLADADYRGFLQTRIKTKPKPGLIVDTAGKILGTHRGIIFYTIGQRQGLGVAMGYPIYVVKIDRLHNKIVLGTKEEAKGSQFLVTKPHFIIAPAKKKIAAMVKIRYNHKETPAKITFLGNKLKVILQGPQFAITPGQSAVFYRRDTVLGGGIIDQLLG